MLVKSSKSCIFTLDSDFRISNFMILETGFNNLIIHYLNIIGKGIG